LKFLILDEIEFFEILFEGRLKIIICCPKFIYYKKTRLEKEIKLSQISKATQSSESDTDFTQDITINRVFVASICMMKKRRQLRLE
jgi:hypothetical protein